MLWHYSLFVRPYPCRGQDSHIEVLFYVVWFHTGRDKFFVMIFCLTVECMLQKWVGLVKGVSGLVREVAG